MEGTLWKWTNYWNGWQPRWFILNTGVLAYYKSQEEVNQGCKGFIKMSACEIVVHPTDNTRLDLVIPAEQHFYLKAATPQERQQWLVALGTSKASYSSRQKKDSVSSSPDTLKSKRSELRLYCDLLMQQVHSVKAVAENPDGPEIEKLNEATSLLGATCDTFIKTLEDCMIMVNASLPFEPPRGPSDPALPPSVPTSNHRKNGKPPVYRSNSADRFNIPHTHSKLTRIIRIPEENGTKSIPVPSVREEKSGLLAKNDSCKRPAPDTPPESPSSEDPESGSDSASSGDDRENKPSLANSDNKVSKSRTVSTTDSSADEGLDSSIHNIKTFFSDLPFSFLNIELTEGNGIPTDHFLSSCSVVLQIFDLLGSPIFTPLKMDVQGNIRKINAKYQKDTRNFVTLQDIVRYEMETNTTLVRNSATDALMWLKRGLEFVREFLLEFTNGNPDIASCALNAYARTLKRFHGWIIRNVIMAAAHKVPKREQVLKVLAHTIDDYHHPAYEQRLVYEGRLFLTAMNKLITILNEFYILHKLDKEEIV